MKKYILFSLLHMLLGQKKKQKSRRSAGDIFVYDRDGYEIFRKRPKSPKLFRYVRYAAFAAVLFVLALGGLAVWGVVSAVNYAGSLVKETPITEQIAKGEKKLRTVWEEPAALNIAVGKAKLAEIAKQPITTEACLNRLTGLLAPSTWLTMPLSTHWDNIKGACFGGR